MIPVKTLPRFKCGFCKKRGVGYAIERHERRCFRNPNRFCDFCENKGYVTEYEPENGSTADWPCQFCEKRDLKMEKEIADYEAATKK